MSERHSPSQHDSAEALIMDFVTLRRAGDATAAERCLERLLSLHAEPVIRGIARRKLFNGAPGRTYDTQDEEDVRSNVVLQVISRLQQLGQSATSLASFPGYVAGIAHNCCSELVRRKYPAYSRLKSRLRYACRHSRALRLVADDEDWLCGLATWPDVGAADERRAPSTEGMQAATFLASLRPRTAAKDMSLEELTVALLRWHDRWIPLDELVAVVAAVLDIHEAPRTVSIDQEMRPLLSALLVDPTPDPGSRAELQSSLRELWREIRELPRGQRVALLLNLRDDEQRDALTLLPLTGVATLEEIAGALEISFDQFVPLWKELPLEDLAIAAVLGSTRQQVINLRKAGRERLARRMSVR